MVCDLLATQCKEAVLVRCMQREQLELVADTLDCLIEALQGPCVGNQDFVANHPTMGILKHILMEPHFPNVYDEERVVVMQVRARVGGWVAVVQSTNPNLSYSSHQDSASHLTTLALALSLASQVQLKVMQMIAACLEGRQEGSNDAVVCGKLSDTLEAAMLHNFGSKCLQRINACVVSTVPTRTGIVIGRSPRARQSVRGTPLASTFAAQCPSHHTAHCRRTGVWTPSCLPRPPSSTLHR